MASLSARGRSKHLACGGKGARALWMPDGNQRFDPMSES